MISFEIRIGKRLHVLILLSSRIEKEGVKISTVLYSLDAQWFGELLERIFLFMLL